MATAPQNVVQRRHLGFAIRTLRRERGLSQAALAHTLGISRTHLGDLERGTQSNPQLDLLIRLLHALDLSSMEQLFSALPEWGSEALKRERPLVNAG